MHAGAHRIGGSVPARLARAGIGGPLVATPDGTAVVLGIGINVAQRGDELPVPSASSLALAGAVVDRTVLLATVLARWAELDDRWRAHDGDAGAAGLAGVVAAREKGLISATDRVAVMVTGHGLKDPEAALGRVRIPDPVPPLE